MHAVSPPTPPTPSPNHHNSFYPLYPAAPGACLDTTSDAALAIDPLPDLLLLPSDLAPFAKAVPATGFFSECAAANANAAATAAGTSGSSENGAAAREPQQQQQQPQQLPQQQQQPHTVLAVNPGRLVKGNGGGTFAVLTAAPGASGAQGGLAGNCRVEILRV